MSLRSGGSVTQTLLKQRKPETCDRRPVKKTRQRLGRLGLALLVLLVLYIAPGVVIRYSPTVQSLLIYNNYMSVPFFSNLSNTAEFGLRNTRNFDLVQHDACAVSSWHVLPATYQEDITLSQDYVRALSDGATIILYLHGNTGTRGTQHRVQQYKYFADRGYHVVTFDYRGFGDSTCTPTERGMMEDSLLVWNWIQKHAPKSRVFIWGHSLGAAAATYLSRELWVKGAAHPRGVILDAPFTSMIEAAANHPFGAPYWPVLPLFRYFVIETFQERFNSEARLRLIPYPLLILHGHKDIIIPYHQGRRMYETAMESRRRNPLLSKRVHFVDCGDTGHKTNIESPDLAAALDHVVDGK